MAINARDLFIKHAAAQFELSSELLAGVLKRGFVVLLKASKPGHVEALEFGARSKCSKARHCGSSLAVHCLPIRTRLAEPIGQLPEAGGEERLLEGSCQPLPRWGDALGEKIRVVVTKRS